MSRTSEDILERETPAAEGLARVELEALRNATSLAHEYSPVFLREAGLYPYRAANGQVRLALADPSRRDAINAILLTLPPPVELRLAKAEEIELMLDSLAHAEHEASENQAPAASESGSEEDVNSLRDLASGAPVVRFLDEVFDRAIGMRATDIHIEPLGTEAQIRIRVDGMLRTLPPPRTGNVAARALVSRVKILSSLNIAERRIPQDGRMRIKVRNRDFDLRVATMPTTHGEAAILRLLDRSTKAVDFDQLGFNRRDEALLKRALNLPHGMLIVTGPTGSGKTTTLAGALGSLDHATRKVLTIEDPVEYQIGGVSQSQVRPAVGLTFASALRAFLRQDPDVIMVGEIRDSETAKIAIQAALTGHLVMTTLHTNTAAAAITRLVDIGVEPYLIASTLTVILGQRLLRVLCPDCKRGYAVGSQELDADPRLIALDIKPGTRLHAANGCERCGHSGYRGRRAIFEVLEVTEGVRKLILAGADDAAIEKQARAEGMTTMMEDGREKCLAGLTTVDEVFRVASFR
ncbi:MAG TPA: GspE/PulE family protein [Methylovirgula sp.]|nr:GspE/PulE family protein [Methylovirgula sp.]